MKKRIICLLMLLAILCCIACETVQDENSSAGEVISKEESSEAIQAESSEEKSFEESSLEESSEEESVEESIEESSEQIIEDDSPIEVMYCSFEQKPYAVIVGKCAQGSKVKGISSRGDEYETESFYGWFSLRFKYLSGITLKLSQSSDDYAVEKEYKPIPKAPDTSEGIVAGNNGQFFYQKSLKDFQHTNTVNDSVLKSATQRIKSRVNTLKSNNMNTKIIYMIVPSVLTVYPECVPDMYKQGSGKSLRQQTMDALRDGGAIVIDLEDVFSKHKNDVQTIYYKTDSHWTEYAAFLAYTELFNIISEDFPAAKPLAYDDFEWIEGYYKTGDMLSYLNMTSSVYLNPSITEKDCLEYQWFRTEANNITGIKRRRFENTGVYSEDVTAKFISDSKNESLPNCLLIRDSYGTQLTDLIAGNSNICYFQGMWGYSYNYNVIKSYKINYVIYVVSEWNTQQVLYN